MRVGIVGIRGQHVGQEGVSVVGGFGIGVKGKQEGLGRVGRNGGTGGDTMGRKDREKVDGTEWGGMRVGFARWRRKLIEEDEEEVLGTPIRLFHAQTSAGQHSTFCLLNIVVDNRVNNNIL